MKSMYGGLQLPAASWGGGEEAGDEVIGGDLEEVGVANSARGDLVQVAAGMEGAPGRDVDWARDVAGEQCRGRLGGRPRGGRRKAGRGGRRPRRRPARRR